MTDEGGELLDLGRERRLRRLDAGLGELLTRRPDLADRTRAMLAGELPALDLEDRMGTNDTGVSLRLPTSAVERAAALVEDLAADPMLQGAARGVTRSVVLRLA